MGYSDERPKRGRAACSVSGALQQQHAPVRVFTKICIVAVFARCVWRLGLSEGSKGICWPIATAEVKIAERRFLEDPAGWMQLRPHLRSGATCAALTCFGSLEKANGSS